MKSLTIRSFVKLLYIKVIFSASLCLLFALYSTTPSIAFEKKDWYEDNPTYTDTYDHYSDFSHSTPADENMSNATLSAGIEAVKNDYVFSFIILRNGKIVKEVYTNGSGREDSNNIHSASNIMLPALVGVAIEDKYINSVNDKIKDYLTDWYPTNDSNKDDITIQHLMEMASGLNWTEDKTEYYVDDYEDWQAKILERNLDTTPGTDFNYSTGVAHLISTVLGEAHPTLTLREYAEDKLFDPLNITIEHWRTDPFGYQTGGCNLYLTPLEMAKFGQTYLDDGVWDSTQVIPSSMVTDSLSYKINIDSDYDYGYLWYIMNIDGYDVYKAWGFGGQFIYLIPDLDIVFVTTANTAAGENDDGVEINDVTFVKDYLIHSVYTGTPPAGSADNDLTFSDNFDDGNLDGWFIDGYEPFTTNKLYNSPSYCARLAGTSEIIKTIDVTGESRVSLSCAVDTANYDTQEKLFIETSQDGSNWTTEWSGNPVCQNVGKFEEKSFTVDVSDGNTLYIKFRTNADGNFDEAYIDDITVTQLSEE
jgi:CubicO group peptidase (beta-lactamase class C family)